MARPIKETPTLYGEDARRFEYAVEHPQAITSEEKRQIKADYEEIRSHCSFHND